MIYCSTFQIAHSDQTNFVNLVNTDFAIECFDQAGYHGLPRYAMKDELVRELCYFFVIDKARTAIEKFKEGLNTLDVLDMLKRHPSIFRPYFCYGPIKLTAQSVDDIFKPLFSEEGTRMREREELLVMHWRDYLQDCEGNSPMAHTAVLNCEFSLIYINF